MSDVVSSDGVNEAQDLAPSASEPAEVVRRFGALLAAEREKQGLAVTDIAARLRFHPRQILALEQEDLAALPAAPFLRGFLRNYARELKIDSKPLLEALDAKLGAAANANSEFAQATPDVEKALIKSMRPPTIQTLARERVSRTTVVAGVVGALVVLTAVGLIASKRAQQVHVQAQADGAAKKAEAPMAVAADAMTLAPLAPSEPVAPQVAVPSPMADAAPALPESAATPVPVPLQAPAVAQTPASVTPSQAAVAATGLHLKFDESAWVEVTQGDGKLLLSQLNEAGSEKVLIGMPPLRAVIGNASGVTVEYRGRTIDLKPVTSADNVARITLK